MAISETKKGREGLCERETFKQTHYWSEKVHQEGHTERWTSQKGEKYAEPLSQEQTSSCRASVDRAAQTRVRVVSEEAAETPRHQITQDLL